MNSSDELGPQSPADRRAAALATRGTAARAQEAQVHPVHRNNGDDARYADRRGSFTKGLPHDPVTGLVNPLAYEELLAALRSGVPEHFERVPLGGARKLVNPQAGLAFDTEGADSHALTQPPAPAFESAEEVAEIVENYWMALLRDVHFDEYPSSAGAADAAAELTTFGSEFKGAKEASGGALAVTPRTLFRGLTSGDKIGPYVSQFLLQPVPFGAQGFHQTMTTPKGGKDFVTEWGEYVAVQNGAARGFAPAQFEPTPVYIRNGRDLSQWVHIDVLFQAYFNAALILLQGLDAPTPVRVPGGAGAPPNPGNPYLLSRTQDAFGTFGGPYIAATLCEVATRALKAVWFEKWFLHRRLRPEAFAARVHTNKIGTTSFALDARAATTPVLQKVYDHNAAQNGGMGTYLLPLAFPEGSPTHPAYGAGHATVAGACVTILKAFFDEKKKISELFAPKRASATGTSLEAYTGSDAGEMTVGGELNKLASNVAIGRNIAGVHWRSDGTESLFLGEQVAIALLRDHRLTFNERFGGYRFTTFAGHEVIV